MSARVGGRGLGLAVAAVIACACAPAVAAAQRPSADTFRLAPTADGVVTLPGAHTPGHLLGSIALSFDYALDPVTAPAPGDDPVVVGHRLTAHAVGQLGLGARGALVVDVPAVLIQAGGLVGEDGEGIPRAATGDIAVDGRVRIVGELPAVPGEVPLGFGLAAVAGATVPTGRASAFAGDRQVLVRADLVAAYELGPGLGVQASAGYLLRPYDRSLGDATIGDAFRFAVGAKGPLPSQPALGFRLELRGEVGPGGPGRNLFEVDGGAVLRTGDVAFTAIAGAGFGRGFGSPDFRGVIAVGWAPRAKDADSDGIPDEDDDCPRLPEDLDGFEDDDGCDDPDNDQDFVLDPDDRCPGDPADPEADADMDGCTDPP